MHKAIYSLPRKPYRSDLTDGQWNRIKRLLQKDKSTGRPRCDDREVINGIPLQMIDAWNKGNGKDFAAPFSENADFIVFEGTH